MDIDKKQLNIAKNYSEALLKIGKEQNDTEKAETLKPHLRGSRCLAGYKCSSPCAFKDGITGERIA